MPRSGHAPSPRSGRYVTGWLALLATTACGGPPPAAQSPVPVAEPEMPAAREDPVPEEAPFVSVLPHDELPGGSWAEKTLASLTLPEKAGQLIMPWVIGDFAPEGSASHQRVLDYLEQQGVGGIIMSVGSPTEVAAKVNDFQRHSKIPLLVAADLETGAGFRMWGAVYMPGTIELGGATNFPTLMALGATGDTTLSYAMGRITAEEARAVGIHVPFAPVLDVNNNPDNPIINVRSFGEDPTMVGRLGAAFVRGIEEHGGIATGKHFPGHGDTGTDSHLALPTIQVSRARMDSVELRPFREAIGAGMGGIMTAHITVPSLNGGNGEPATLSPRVLTDLLRGELAFDGLVFTDAMDMTAISGRLGSGEAAVQAVLAGADVILMPASVERAVEGIVDAVESGRISLERLDASVLRLLRTKEALGLDRQREVDLAAIPAKVGIPANTEIAREIAEKSVTLVRNGRNLLPLLGTRSARVMSVTYRRTSDVLAGRYFNQRLRRTYARLTTVDIDRDASAALYEGILRQARNSNLVVVSTYVTAVSYAGTVALPEETVDFVKKLGDAGIPHIVVSFGNPYLITDFPDVQAYLVAWSGSAASQRAAAEALLGGIGIQGRTPTRIPGFAEIGDGIQVPAKAGSGGE
ncbi:MAG TPA: glycoside hydrolase family 3 N-terminal domain-containing protein [Longimicrobiales bacterium]|nr:glycoside hydrolase family 3 N-terminal domain-containing protein [Longimicrobiales bacterium]